MKIFKVLFILTACILASTLTAQWSDDASVNTAVAILEGSQAVPKVGNGPDGDVYIGFYSNEAGNYDVRLQRYNSEGYQQWDDNGLLISDHPTMTWVTDWDMTVDQDNNAILVFQDIRTGSNDVFAYSIAPNGAFNWGEDGLQLSNTTAEDYSPNVTITSDNNVIVAWSTLEDIILQKISSTGELLWGDSGITLSGDNDYTWPQVIPIENDEIILKFFEDSGNFPATTRHVLAQRIDADGNLVWPEDTIISNAGGISIWTQIFSMVSDGNNGFFIAWDDDRDMNMDEQGYIQHIDSDGNALFTDNGIEIATTGNRERFSPQLVYDSSSEELTAYWRNTDSSQNSIGICGQKFDINGDYLWGFDGIDIINLSATNLQIIGVRDSPFGIAIIFEEAHDAINSVIKAMLLDSDGEFVWDDQNVELCSIDSQKLHPVASDFASNQWVAVWEDTRNDGGDIYAQNVSFNGELGQVQTLAGVSGNVLIYEGEGNVEEVLISSGTSSTNPDADGSYTLILDPGIYNISASLEGYETVVEEGVEVLVETVTDNVNFLLELEEFDPPYNVMIDPETGILTWEHPYVIGEEAEEGFEAEDLPEGWMNIDSDGDSLNWFLYTYNPHGGSKSIASASWISPIGALNPDNWLISPALEIGTDSELHFWYAAQDESYPAENFGVYLSTTGYEITDFTENVFEVIVESNVWTEAVIDLSDHLDETVYLAWRHFDCTDQFYLKIDDISLVNSTTREITYLADFENGINRDNSISCRDSRDRDLESYNVYLDGELMTNTTDLTYTYEGLINGQLYEAGVSAVYTFGESEEEIIEFTYEGTGSDDDFIVTKTSLIGNYPNPFNPNTSISFQLAKEDQVELTIYNARGQKVKQLLKNNMPVGMNVINWDGTDDNHLPVTSGIYFYKLSTKDYREVKKMILLR
ncbi:choice-of-anchor J domain-containing protein [Candidatus Cloacimonadota bacterium]